MEWYGSTVSSKLGLTPESQRLQVSARCDVLRDTGACPRRGGHGSRKPARITR